MIGLFLLFLLFFLSVYLATDIVFISGWIKKDNVVKNNNEADITLIIPVRNERQQLQGIAQRLNKQSFKHFSVILVDDHSDDGSAEIIQQLNFREGIRYSPLRSSGSGKKAALKTAIEQTSSEWIVTTDADCSWDNRWLETMCLYMTTPTDLIFGPVVIAETKNWWTQIQAWDQLSLTSSSIGAARLKLPFICSAANMAFRKSTWMSSDLQPALSSGDDVFLLHAVKNNKPAAITAISQPGSLVYTNPVKTPSSFFQQRVRWAGKTAHYRDKLSVFIAVTVFMINFIILVGLSISAIYPQLLPYLLISLGIKGAFDILLLFLARRQLKFSLSGITVGPALIFHLIYVPVAGIFSLIWRPDWKGSKQ